ncbi:MAG: asparagine--tRNA ligase [Candidatus Woesearchaeota archaeon]|nr:MAG: asparagine--tRNA ligase [Candidatus Woesearchaeota archaeon]
MKFTSIKESLEKRKGKVSIRGWVYRERKQKDTAFLVLRDSTDIIQCVVKQDKISKKEWEEIQKILIESSVELEGTLKEDKRAPTGFEIQVEKIKVIGFSEKFPIAKDQSPEFLLDVRHLWLRSRKMTAILKIRSTIFRAIHDYFRSLSYYEYHSPSFTPTAAEGGSTLFKVDYFGKEVYLTQTWQLYAEAAIFSLEKIYTIAPSFRAEKSKTARHLTEYWHTEVETAWQSFDELLDLGEGLIKHIVKEVLSKHQEELKILGRDIKKLEPVIKKKFPRIKYTEALKLLKEKKGLTIPHGKDLRTIEEDKLSELFDTPVFVTHYPKEIKAFYMKQDPKDPKYVLGTDLVAPEGYGELIGGSERETDLKELIKRLKSQGEDIKKYEFFLDTRRYGSVPHSGFGMGVERVISWICGLDSIKDAIPFPRTMLRVTP